MNSCIIFISYFYRKSEILPYFYLVFSIENQKFYLIFIQNFLRKLTFDSGLDTFPLSALERSVCGLLKTAVRLLLRRRRIFRRPINKKIEKVWACPNLQCGCARDLIFVCSPGCCEWMRSTISTRRSLFVKVRHSDRSAVFSILRKLTTRKSGLVQIKTRRISSLLIVTLPNLKEHFILIAFACMMGIVLIRWTFFQTLFCF